MHEAAKLIGYLALAYLAVCLPAIIVTVISSIVDASTFGIRRRW